MRDQWVGDQRDYMKYFILRKLATHLPIQVCWMLWREDKISYLEEPERREGLDKLGEELYDVPRSCPAPRAPPRRSRKSSSATR